MLYLRKFKFQKTIELSFKFFFLQIKHKFGPKGFRFISFFIRLSNTTHVSVFRIAFAVTETHTHSLQNLILLCGLEIILINYRKSHQFFNHNYKSWKLSIFGLIFSKIFQTINNLNAIKSLKKTQKQCNSIGISEREFNFKIKLRFPNIMAKMMTRANDWENSSQ